MSLRNNSPHNLTHDAPNEISYEFKKDSTEELDGVNFSDVIVPNPYLMRVPNAPYMCVTVGVVVGVFRVSSKREKRQAAIKLLLESYSESTVKICDNYNIAWDHYFNEWTAGRVVLVQELTGNSVDMVSAVGEDTCGCTLYSPPHNPTCPHKVLDNRTSPELRGCIGIVEIESDDDEMYTTSIKENSNVAEDTKEVHSTPSSIDVKYASMAELRASEVQDVATCGGSTAVQTEVREFAGIVCEDSDLVPDAGTNLQSGTTMPAQSSWNFRTAAFPTRPETAPAIRFSSVPSPNSTTGSPHARRHFKPAAFQKIPVFRYTSVPNDVMHIHHHVHSESKGTSGNYVAASLPSIPKDVPDITKADPNSHHARSVMEETNLPRYSQMETVDDVKIKIEDDDSDFNIPPTPVSGPVFRPLFDDSQEVEDHVGLVNYFSDDDKDSRSTSSGYYSSDRSLPYSVLHSDDYINNVGRNPKKLRLPVKRKRVPQPHPFLVDGTKEYLIQLRKEIEAYDAVDPPASSMPDSDIANASPAVVEQVLIPDSDDAMSRQNSDDDMESVVSEDSNNSSASNTSSPKSENDGRQLSASKLILDFSIGVRECLARVDDHTREPSGSNDRCFRHYAVMAQFLEDVEGMLDTLEVNLNNIISSNN